MLDEFEFFNFFTVTSNFQKFNVSTKLPVCGSQNQVTFTSSKKELCEIGEEAIWESRFTSFLRFFTAPIKMNVILMH